MIQHDPAGPHYGQIFRQSLHTHPHQQEKLSYGDISLPSSTSSPHRTSNVVQPKQVSRTAVQGSVSTTPQSRNYNLLHSSSKPQHQKQHSHSSQRTQKPVVVTPPPLLSIKTLLHTEDNSPDAHNNEPGSIDIPQSGQQQWISSHRAHHTGEPYIILLFIPTHLFPFSIFNIVYVLIIEPSISINNSSSRSFRPSIPYHPPSLQ